MSIESGGKGGNDELAQKDFKDIIDQLAGSIQRERRTAAGIGALAVASGLAAPALLIWLSQSGLDAIQATTDPTEMTATTIYLLVRGTAFAGVLGGIIYAVFSLARSALDQATRFDKRLIAARFIDYAVHSDGVSVEKMKLASEVLGAWGASVESAYTPTKSAGKKSERLKASAGKDGLSLEHSTANRRD